MKLNIRTSVPLKNNLFNYTSFKNEKIFFWVFGTHAHSSRHITINTVGRYANKDEFLKTKRLCTTISKYDVNT